jgi:hypothetical protein
MDGNEACYVLILQPEKFKLLSLGEGQLRAAGENAVLFVESQQSSSSASYLVDCDLYDSNLVDYSKLEDTSVATVTDFEGQAFVDSTLRKACFKCPDDTILVVTRMHVGLACTRSGQLFLLEKSIQNCKSAWTATETQALLHAVPHEAWAMDHSTFIFVASTTNTKNNKTEKMWLQVGIHNQRVEVFPYSNRDGLFDAASVDSCDVCTRAD